MVMEMYKNENRAAFTTCNEYNKVCLFVCGEKMNGRIIMTKEWNYTFWILYAELSSLDYHLH